MEKNFLSGIYLELLRAWPNRWLAVIVAGISAATVALFAIAIPDTYESKSQVYVNSEVFLRPLLRGITPEEDSDSRTKLLKILQSTVLNDDKINEIISTPGIGFDVSTPRGRSAAVKAIRTGVKIAEQEETENLFDLTYRDPDPTRARAVLQGLLAILLESRSGQSKQDYGQAEEFLDAQIKEYAAKLNEMEAQMRAFRLANANVLGTPNHQQRLDVALTALRDAQLARQIALANRNRVKALVEGRATPGANGSTAVFATDQTFPAAVDRLGALQQQLNQLLLTYTEEHPDVIATRREIAQLTEQYGLSQELQQVVKPFTALPGQVPPSQAVDAAITGQNGPMTAAAEAVGKPAPVTRVASVETNSLRMQLVRANFAVLDAERKVRDATAAVQAIDVDAETAPVAEATLEQLTRDYTVVKENYEQLVRKRESAKITAAVDVSTGDKQFRIVQPPTLPGSPAAPDRPTIMMIGTLVSLLAGAGLAYGLGLLRGAFVSAAEAEQALGLPVVARLTNHQGVISRVSGFADSMLLLGAIGGMFVATYVLSATASWAEPIRAKVYHLLEGALGSLMGLLH